MAIIVEDGTGKADANSFASVAEADAYVALRDVAHWANLSTAHKEAALVVATDYLEATYREAWKGDRLTQPQALSWPREGAYVDGFEVAANIVPKAVKSATIELAIRRSSGVDLLADLRQGVKREKVDVLEVEYQDGSVAMLRFPLVSRLLQPYLLSSSSEGGAFSARVRRT